MFCCILDFGCFGCFGFWGFVATLGLLSFVVAIDLVAVFWV